MKGQGNRVFWAARRGRGEKKEWKRAGLRDTVSKQRGAEGNKDALHWLHFFFLRLWNNVQLRFNCLLEMPRNSENGGTGFSMYIPT